MREKKYNVVDRSAQGKCLAYYCLYKWFPTIHRPITRVVYVVNGTTIQDGFGKQLLEIMVLPSLSLLCKLYTVAVCRRALFLSASFWSIPIGHNQGWALKNKLSCQREFCENGLTKARMNDSVSTKCVIMLHLITVYVNHLCSVFTN
jgi:hypothetical protein